MSQDNKTVSIAVLDDYQGLSRKHFDTLQSSNSSLKTSYFPDTLSPHTTSGLDALAQRLHNHNVIVTMRERTPFPAALLSHLPDLKLLLTTGTRNASIDLAQCQKQGIIVAGTTTPAGPKGKHPKPDSTTTHTWALILALARHVARDHANVVNGQWQGPTLATGVSGKTLGLIGLGRLGTAVGRIAVVAWGMRVIVWSPSMSQERADEQANSAGLDAGDFECVDKEALFREADVVSLHMVLSDRSRGIVGDEELALMKKSALLVNTSRGPLVDEAALLRVCREGKIKGAALDVFDEEPLPKDSGWRSEEWGTGGRSDVLLSPHMGYGQEDVIEEWYRQCAENVKRWLEGREVEAKL